jgi:hypothetical protein
MCHDHHALTKKSLPSGFMSQAAPMLTKLLLAIAVIALHGPALGATIEPQSVKSRQTL